MLGSLADGVEAEETQGEGARTFPPQLSRPRS